MSLTKQDLKDIRFVVLETALEALDFAVTPRLDKLESRMDKLEARITSLETRMGSLESEF